jgi:beta-galactosidase
VHVGACHYPEQWPEPEWARDAAAMAAMGLDVVHLGDMIWSGFEPSPGSFDLAWMERAIETFAHEGLEVILCTPTATLPPWLVEQDPEVLPVGEDGLRTSYGSWGAVCLSSPLYRERVELAVERLAERFGAHPAVIGWQIDCELHSNACYCDRCRAGFQRWLAERYGSIEALNRAWGTAFLGNQYGDWRQIPAPRRVRVFQHNPSLILDYARFLSDLHVRHVDAQARILRRLSPGRFLTHNIPGRGSGTPIDYFRLATLLDRAGFDNYPGWRSGGPAELALTMDLVRGLKRGRFLVLEEQSGRLDRPTIRLPERGQLRLWAHQGAARGASGIVFFQWRSGRSGSEQYIGSVLHPDGRRGPTFDELAQATSELRRLGPLLEDTHVEARVGIVHSYESLWALGHQLVSEVADPWAYYEAWHERLFRRNIVCDIVSSEADPADWRAYSLLLAPALLIVDPELAERLRRYVEGGGVLVLGPRSGSKTVGNALPTTAFPGELSPLVGAKVTDYGALETGRAVELLDSEGSRRVRAEIWLEALEVTEAASVLLHVDGRFAGRAAAVRRSVGGGSVYYAGCLGGEVVDDVLDLALADASVERGPAGPKGVEVVVHASAKRRVWFVLNHLETAERLTLPAGPGFRDGFTAEPCPDPLLLEPFDVRVLLAAVEPCAP